MSKDREQGRATILIVVLSAIALAVITYTVHWYLQPRPGHVKDEALRAGRDASSFLASDVDYFKDMDGGIDLKR